MNKKIWIPAEIIIIGVESTEANCHDGTVPDGEYCDRDPKHLFPLYS